MENAPAAAEASTLDSRELAVALMDISADVRRKSHEGTGVPVNPIAAALILADKSDVRRSRVRLAGSKSKMDMINVNDIHDRVNYAVEKSDIYFSEDKKTLILDLQIDLDICSIMDYFEIFLGRMSLCRNSARTLGVDFSVVINGSKIL